MANAPFLTFFFLPPAVVGYLTTSSEASEPYSAAPSEASEPTSSSSSSPDPASAFSSSSY